MPPILEGFRCPAPRPSGPDRATRRYWSDHHAGLSAVTVRYPAPCPSAVGVVVARRLSSVVKSSGDSTEVSRVLTTRRDSHQREIEDRAREAFGFLEQTAGTMAKLKTEAGRTLLSYLLPSLFVEIELDWRELTVFVLVGDPVEGEFPSGYYVDNTGRRVRWHLAAVLEEGGYANDAANLKKVAKVSGATAMLQQLETYAAELRKVVPDLPRVIKLLQSA